MDAVGWFDWLLHQPTEGSIQTSKLFLAGGREDTVGLQKSKRTIKKHKTTDKRKFKKKIKKALILTLLQILRDVSK